MSAAGSFVDKHPWMTFFLASSAIGAVASILKRPSLPMPSGGEGGAITGGLLDFDLRMSDRSGVTGMLASYGQSDLYGPGEDVSSIYLPDQTRNYVERPNEEFDSIADTYTSEYSEPERNYVEIPGNSDSAPPTSDFVGPLTAPGFDFKKNLPLIAGVGLLGVAALSMMGGGSRRSYAGRRRSRR